MSSKVRAVAALRPDPTVCISGMTGEGLPELMALISSKLSAGMEEVEVLLPHTRGDLVEQVHSTGEVQALEYREEGVWFKAKVPASVAGRIEQYSLRPVAARPKRVARKRDLWQEAEGGDRAVTAIPEGAEEEEEGEELLSRSVTVASAV